VSYYDIPRYYYVVIIQGDHVVLVCVVPSRANITAPAIGMYACTFESHTPDFQYLIDSLLFSVSAATIAYEMAALDEQRKSEFLMAQAVRYPTSITVNICFTPFYDQSFLIRFWINTNPRYILTSSTICTIYSTMRFVRYTPR